MEGPEVNEKEWFIHAYDEIVGAEADGIDQDKLRDAMARDYLDARERGEVESSSDMDMARAKADHYLRPIRQGRRGSFRKDVEYLLDALNDETILGTEEPRLQQAIPVGNGIDKRLAYWTAEDWATAVNARQKNVQAAAAAATDFTDLATRVIGQMAQRGARFVIDMFGGAS